MSEAHHDEVDQADPFYAHCRVHSDKFLIKNRKKNFNALLVQMKRYENEVGIVRADKTPEELERIERKLKKHRIKYATNKLNRPEAWGKLFPLILLSDTCYIQFLYLISSNSKNAKIINN